MNKVIEKVYELLTGKPYYTTVNVTDEYGPTPAARYPELLDYDDLELIRRDLPDLIAEIEAKRARLRRLTARTTADIR